jgi:hypothetical protein
VKPKVKVVKKMKPGPVEDQLALGFFVGSKKSRSGKASRETLHNAVVPLAVLEKVKKVEHLGGGSKSHNPAALAKGSTEVATYYGAKPYWT